MARAYLMNIWCITRSCDGNLLLRHAEGNNHLQAFRAFLVRILKGFFKNLIRKTGTDYFARTSFHIPLTWLGNLRPPQKDVENAIEFYKALHL